MPLAQHLMNVCAVKSCIMWVSKLELSDVQVVCPYCSVYIYMDIGVCLSNTKDEKSTNQDLYTPVL